MQSATLLALRPHFQNTILTMASADRLIFQFVLLIYKNERNWTERERSTVLGGYIYPQLREKTSWCIVRAVNLINDESQMLDPLQFGKDEPWISTIPPGNTKHFGSKSMAFVHNSHYCPVVG